MRKLLLLSLAAWAGLVLPARAQYVCHITQASYIGTDEYWFAAVSGEGSNCLVMALGGPYGFGHSSRILFLRSSDEGETRDH